MHPSLLLQHEEEMAAKNLLSLSPVLLGRPRAYSHMEPLRACRLPCVRAAWASPSLRVARHGTAHAVLVRPSLSRPGMRLGVPAETLSAMATLELPAAVRGGTACPATVPRPR